MSRPFISDLAKSDIDQIWDYVAEDSPGAADRVVDEIYAAAQILADMPEIGHVREDLADKSLRFWRVHSYLIVYRLDTKPLEIVRVLSGYRDITSLL